MPIRLKAGWGMPGLVRLADERVVRAGEDFPADAPASDLAWLAKAGYIEGEQTPPSARDERDAAKDDSPTGDASPADDAAQPAAPPQKKRGGRKPKDDSPTGDASPADDAAPEP